MSCPGSGWHEGDVILTSHPFAHVLVIQERDRRCENCFKNSDDLRRCTGCSLVKYCNVSCQKRSWKYHRQECKHLQRISPHIPKDSVLLFHHILLQLNHENGDPACEQAFGVKRQFSDLVAHSDQLKNDAKRCEEFLQLCSALKIFVGDEFKLPSASELLQIFGKMTINTFSICDAEMQPIGAGIYLGASCLDHSCCPNAVTVFNGTTLEVRCIRPISTNEQVLISYIDQLETTADRRSQLEASYYFTCRCPSCLDSNTDACMQSLCCPTLNCTGMIMQQQDGNFVPCSKCGLSEFGKEYRETRQSAVTNCLQLLEQAKQLKRDGSSRQLLELCERCLGKECPALHSLNILHIKVLDRAFDACIDTAEWHKAIRYGTELTALYRNYLQKYHPTIGVHLMKLGKIQLFLEQVAEAECTLKQAAAVISVTHGTHHSLYDELQQLLLQTVVEQRSDSQRLSIEDASVDGDCDS